MSKSIIPFIFENQFLNSIFIEATNSKFITKKFNFQVSDLEHLRISKFEIVITDYPVFKKIINEEIEINQIFLINDFNVDINESEIGSEISKLNSPFKMQDIFQRIENYFTQVNINNRRMLKYKYFTYDPSTRKLSHKSLFLRFTEKESQIFFCLLENTDSYVSKKDLLHKVWSYGEGIDTHTLETHVYALRRKVETKLKIRDFILFEEKKGYYLNKSIL